jgi:hypothetical protein
MTHNAWHISKDTLQNKEEDDKIMYTIIVTKYNGGDGITETEYNYIDKYKITDDFLILEDSKMGVLHYITKDQVLEFEVNW